MNGDFIILQRSILEWEWWQDINTTRLFIFMLLKANWKEGKFKGKTVPRGSFISSVAKLSDGTGLSNDEVRTALKHLLSSQTITKQSTNKYTLFSVVNYDLYQIRTQANEQTEPEQIPDKSQPIPNLFPTIEKWNKEINKKEKEEKPTAQAVIDLYNSICISFPKVKCLSDSRKKAVNARLRTYDIETVRSVFEKAEASDFLKGKNDRNWNANFDWMMKDSNFAKILDDNYINKNCTTGAKAANKNKFNNFEQRSYDYDELERMLVNSN